MCGILVIMSFYNNSLADLKYIFQYFVNYKLGEDYTVSTDVPYSAHFLKYVGFAAQVPNLVFIWINIFLRIE